ncbi:54S ribosomal protein L22, mitochondrial [Schaereria dolodes]|nr:54S ribosomal protein L22, mitochondrial [Schaereria dolodes]
MNLKLPSRRLFRSSLALSKSHNQSHFALFLRCHQSHQRRTLFEFFRRKKQPPPLDPLAADFLKRKPSTKPSPLPQRGDLAPSSIFESTDLKTSQSSSIAGSSAATPRTPAPIRRDPQIMAAALDPQPMARKRWERNMLIRDIRQRHRLSKTRKILRTERSSLSKSHMFKTSVKKLGPLARQIAGKPIEDAIVQMRFSRKKVAGEVLKHLEYARDEAIVRKGMGLGGVGAEGDVEAQGGNAKVGGEGKKEVEKAIVVIDKKGKRRLVKDKTDMYVDQAWVGRGSYGQMPDYRARGQVNTMRPPYTSISVILKEEATRIRLAEEREQKRQRKKVWVPLPDRPITAQRQYCLW